MNGSSSEEGDSSAVLTDLSHDMFFSDVATAYSKVMVHAGYYCTLFGSGSSNLLSIEEELNKILMQQPDISRILFTGHSMGAAMACLCGMELVECCFALKSWHPREMFSWQEASCCAHRGTMIVSRFTAGLCNQNRRSMPMRGTSSVCLRNTENLEKKLKIIK